MEIQVQDDLTRDTVGPLYRRLLRKLRHAKDRQILLVLDESVQLDGAGVGLLSRLEHDARTAGKQLLVRAGGIRAQEVLSIYPGPSTSARESGPSVGFFERLGNEIAGGFNHGYRFLVLLSDSLGLGFRALVTGRLRPGVLAEQAVRLGSDALPIVMLISFLVGVTVALQAAVQLKQFGANIYIADLVGVAMIAEMGPLMTAVLMAGRSGSSIGAEISTMVIDEEVDALRTMGVNPVRYVVVPRVLALVLTQPLLTVMADVVGVAGGALVAVLYLDLSPHAFWTELVSAVTFKDLWTGLLKSVAFAALIGLSAAHVGFGASGGAAGVGRSTTASVVASIFLVIVADAIFSLIFYF